MGSYRTIARSLLLCGSLAAGAGLNGCMDEADDYADPDEGMPNAGTDASVTNPAGTNSNGRYFSDDAGSATADAGGQGATGQESMGAARSGEGAGYGTDPDRGDSWMARDSSSSSMRDEELSGPREDVQESADVLRRMQEQAPALAERLADARGVFIVPDYATAALLVGGSGGEGVMMENRNGAWGSPGFYDVGNVDIGAQIGAAGGSIVMLLMTEEAVESFREMNDFSLTAQAGLTIVNWSPDASSVGGENDVVVWSDNSGLLAEASVGFGGISWDEEEAEEYYQQEVTPEQVLSGSVRDPRDPSLRSEFPEIAAVEGAQGASVP